MHIHFQTIITVLHLNTMYIFLFQDYMNRHQRVQGNKEDTHSHWILHHPSHQYHQFTYPTSYYTHHLFESITCNILMNVLIISVDQAIINHTIIPCNLQMHIFVAILYRLALYLPFVQGLFTMINNGNFTTCTCSSIQ